MCEESKNSNPRNIGWYLCDDSLCIIVLHIHCVSGWIAVLGLLGRRAEQHMVVKDRRHEKLAVHAAGGTRGREVLAVAHEIGRAHV